MPDIDLDAVLAHSRDDIDRVLKDLFTDRRRDVGRSGHYRVLLEQALRSGCSSDQYRALEDMERWLGPAIERTIMTVFSVHEMPDVTELRRYLPHDLWVKVPDDAVR